MKRGELWTTAGGGEYAGKPRPALVVQDDHFGDVGSVTIALFTSNPTDAPLYRPLIEPSDTNGLSAPSRLMADKIMTVPRQKLGTRIGKLGDTDMLRVNRALLVFLGLAGA